MVINDAMIRYVSQFFTIASLGLLAMFLINNYFIFWQDFPSTLLLLDMILSTSNNYVVSDSKNVVYSSIQLLSYIAVFFVSFLYCQRFGQSNLSIVSNYLTDVSAYIVRFAFWMVLLIGIVDFFLSLLRIENGLEALVGSDITKQLGRPKFRSLYIHFPLIILSFITAYYFRKIHFTWLTLLVVIAEFQIVIFRFIFSYEQAFMGDLVRFWYAALFLFASAYTLLHEGHVRVDVFFDKFSDRAQALSNAIGALILGIPLCWVIIIRGMWEKTYVINSPLLAIEISQSGFGLYVKYLMALFLAIFAVTMLIQFLSYFTKAVGQLIGDVAYDNK